MPELNSYDQYVGDVVPGWETRPAPDPVTLEGRYVRVVPLTSVHYADLFAAVCGPGDDALWTYRPIAKPDVARRPLDAPGRRSWTRRST